MCRQHIVLIAAAAHIGVKDAVPILSAVHTVHGKGDVQRIVFRQVFAGGFSLRAVILAALDALVGAHTDLIGFICGQIWGRLSPCSAHGQRHVDGGDRLPIFETFKVIAEAGIDPSAVLFLIDRHGVAVRAVHRRPFRAHDLVAGE